MRSYFILTFFFLVLCLSSQNAWAKDCGADYQKAMTLMSDNQNMAAEKWLRKSMKKCDTQAVYPFLLARLKHKQHISAETEHGLYQDAWFTYKNNMDVQQYVTIPDILGPMALLELKMKQYHIAIDRFKSLEKFQTSFNNFNYYQALAYKGAGQLDKAKKAFETCLKENSNREKAPICYQYLYPAEVFFETETYQKALRDLKIEDVATQYHQNMFMPRFQTKYPYHLQKCITEEHSKQETYRLKAVISIRKMGGVGAVFFQTQNDVTTCLGDVLRHDVFPMLPSTLSSFETLVDIQLDKPTHQ